MNPKIIEKSIKIMLLYFALLLFGGLLAVYGRGLHIQVQATIYFMILAVAFVGRTSARIADDKVRRLLAATAWMIVAFFVFQGLKYQVFREKDLVGRMLWYLYYLPILFLPTFSLFAAMAVDLKDAKRFLRWCVPISCVSVGFFLLVMTNDLHQLVFQFRPGFQNWDSDYDHGISYYMLAAWVLLLLIAAVFVLLRKCRLSASKKLVWIPVVPILFGVLYVLLYVMGWTPRAHGMLLIEFPETACAVIACFWECCISIGLIPSNKGYEALFMQSSLATQIADSEGNVVYASKTASDLTPEQKASEESLWLDRNTFLRRAAVRGGFVYWQNDMSRINEVNRELTELEERLSEETDLIRLQNEDREKRAAIDEKNRVYDKIAEGVREQSQKIAELAEQCAVKKSDQATTPEQPVKARTACEHASYDEIMGWICFYGAYVKRYSNLVLLAENGKTIPLGELSLAISESLRALELLGIAVTKRDEIDEMMSAQSAVRHTDETETATNLAPEMACAAYESFERLVSCLEGVLQGVYVRLSAKECKLVLEGKQVSLPQELMEACNCIWEDDVLYVSLPLVRGGESA